MPANRLVRERNSRGSGCFLFLPYLVWHLVCEKNTMSISPQVAYLFKTSSLAAASFEGSILISGWFGLEQRAGFEKQCRDWCCKLSVVRLELTATRIEFPHRASDQNHHELLYLDH